MQLQAVASASCAGARGCRRASRRASVVVRASSIKSVRRDVAGERYRETFQVSLLGLEGGKATVQELTAGPATVLVPLVVPRPLGIIFEERRVALNAPAVCVVDEVTPGSNADKAGVRVGDVLRLCSCVVEFREKADTLSYYTNPPKARNRRALLASDGQPFTKLMKALISNKEAVDMPDGSSRFFEDVPLVLERAAEAS